MAGRDAATGGNGAALAGDGAKLGAAESDGDAAPDRVLAAPAPDDFLPRNVLACLLYDGALVTKAHVRAATRLAATSKSWKAVDAAWRATLSSGARSANAHLPRNNRHLALARLPSPTLATADARRCCPSRRNSSASASASSSPSPLSARALSAQNIAETIDPFVAYASRAARAAARARSRDMRARLSSTRLNAPRGTARGVTLVACMYGKP